MIIIRIDTEHPDQQAIVTDAARQIAEALDDGPTGPYYHVEAKPDLGVAFATFERTDV